MSQRKDPNQKGSGAKKHQRNYRGKHQEKFRTYLSVTRYRAAHGIPSGTRKQNHKDGRCPLHNRKTIHG
jgi:hypothetical protein